MDLSKYDDIRPYDDAEAVAALRRVSKRPETAAISKYLFPQNHFWYLGQMLRSCVGVDDFQRKVMSRCVEAVIDNSSYGFGFDGQDNLKSLEGRRFLAISNHRDIVMDPALIEYTLYKAGEELVQLCVGNNLVSNGLINDIMRSNRMIAVKRGISSRELYDASVHLSSYIREAVAGGESSVWIAQKEGRAKDGIDRTSTSVLKMLSLSGTGDFAEDFDALRLVPMSISYEYESCDYLKARELYLSRGQEPYVKKRGEDTRSITTGVKQQKGGIHLSIGRPVGRDELDTIAQRPVPQRFRALAGLLDKRISDGYKLWKTNFMGFDLMTGGDSYLGVLYDRSDLAAFRAYTERQLDKIEERLDRDALREIFWHIYGNPVNA